MLTRILTLSTRVLLIAVVGLAVSCGSDDPVAPDKDDDGTLPAASFTATPVTGPAPLTVQFTDTSTPGSSPITAWSWDFGDGESSTIQNPSHVYTGEGQFNVSLVVSSSVGSNSTTKVGYSNVLPAITEDDPSGTWSVEWTDVTRDCGPAPVADFLIEAAIGIADPVANGWKIAMDGQSGLVVKQEPICLAVSASYDAAQRRCAENLSVPDLVLPVSVIQQICAVVNCPPQVTQYSQFLKEVRVTPTRRPDLVWAPDFQSFSGTYTLAGDVVAVATVPLLGNINIPLGSCSVSFELVGTRCDTCVSPCP